MSGKNIGEVVKQIVREDPRFDAGAYHFVRKALDHTLQEQKREPGSSHHVSGPELLDGIRAYALEQFGPMTLTVFSRWGLKNCADFGEIVFNLVEHEVFGTTPDDRREDFHDHYDFEEAFGEPFRPARVTLQSPLPMVENVDSCGRAHE